MDWETVIKLFTEHQWTWIIALIILLAGFVKNDKWYLMGWKIGAKLVLIAMVAPLAHGLAQLSGSLAAFCRGLGDSLDGKVANP